MASNDYALNLVGDISKFQAELAKLPGFTERTAASAAVKMVAESTKGQEQAAQNAIRAAERAAAAQMAASEKVAAQQVRDAQEVAAARARLETVAASGSAVETQALAYRRQKAEIEALGKATGDTALQTRAMAALNKSFAASLPGATKATDGLATSTRGLSGGLSAVAMQMPDVVSQLSSGAPVMQVLTQQGLQVTQQMMGAAGGVGALGSAMAAAAPIIAAAAVAAAALAAAYAVVTNQVEQFDEAGGRITARLEETRARSDAAAASVAKMSSAWATTQGAVNASIEDLAVAEGLLDKYTVQTNRQTAAFEKQARGAVLATAQQIAAQQAEIEVLKQSISTQMMWGSTRQEMQDRVESLTESIKTGQTTLKEQQKTMADGSFAIAENIRLAKEKEEAEKRAAGAAKARDSADKARTERQARDSALRDQMISQIHAQEAANTALAEVLAGMGDQPDKIEQEYQARIAMISALDGQIEAQRLIDAMSAAEYEREVARYEETRVRLDESTKYTVEAQAEIQRSIDATIAKQAQQQQAHLDGAVEVGQAVTSATQFMLDQQVAATGKANMKLFLLNKAAALATIIARTAEGIATAASLPPPVDAYKLVSVGITNALALAQLATAKPPAFDIGGTVGSGARGGGIGAQTPDQVIIRALPGERVQSREEVAQGQAGPQIQVVAMPVYQHFGRFVNDNLRQQGALRSSIQEGPRTYSRGY
jgi:hypothetical protein